MPLPPSPVRDKRPARDVSLPERTQSEPRRNPARNRQPSQHDLHMHSVDITAAFTNVLRNEVFGSNMGVDNTQKINRSKRPR